jgi:hypothetical protein
MLWTGVNAVDAAKEPGHRNFLLRAILLWTINDYPVYGLINGQQVKGYKRCRVWVKDTFANFLGTLKKIVYLRIRHWHPKNH